MMASKKFFLVRFVQTLIARLLSHFFLAFIRRHPIIIQKKTYFTLCCVNFALLLIVVGSPLMLWHSIDNGQFFIMGWWTVCDHLGCDAIFVTNVFLNAARVLSLIAIITSLTALISMRGVFSQFMETDISDSLISSLSNFITGISIMCALVITNLKLRVPVDTSGKRMSLFCGFFLGSFVSVACFILSINSLQRHMGLFPCEEHLKHEDTPKETIEG